LFATGGGSERARIDSSGRLLVGTSSSASDSLLQIQGVAGSSADQGVISLRRGYTPISDLGTGSPIGKIDFEVSNGGVGARIAAEGDAAMNTNDYPSRLVFSTTADGASSPTEQLRITSDRYIRLASGTGGIQFGGDTAAANALDDYEEGTWTPVFNATGATFTTTSNVARYTKVGNQVTLVGYCQIRCSAGSGANTVTVTGLPFATPNIGNFFQGYLLGNPNIFNGSGFPLGALIQPNTSTIDLKKYSNNSGVTTGANLNSADMTDASFSFQWSITYWSV
jgi:hypothetical protein